jgi:hypothetical protein
MGYRPEYLTVIVECIGARWKFTTPDEALIDFQDYALRKGDAQAAEYAGLLEKLNETLGLSGDKKITLDPPELRKVACAAFREGLVGWEGVESPGGPGLPPAGQPLPFTPETVSGIPMPAKEAVGDAYLMALSALQEKKAEPTLPPTDSTPPGEATAE